MTRKHSKPAPAAPTSWRTRRFDPTKTRVSCRTSAERLAKKDAPLPFRIRTSGRRGVWHTAARRENRPLTRAFSKSTRALLAASPRPIAAIPQAVRNSMRGNKGKDTKPELIVRRKLREAGLDGYRLQWKAPGRPDVAWPGKRVCIMINGCFWHRCPHCNPSMPKSNQEYWVPKFKRNVERDARNLEALRAEGWRVHVIWECELKKDAADRTFAELIPQLKEELGK